MKNIAVFASGKGTNARRLIDFFQHSDKARVSLVLCNKAEAGVLEIAKAAGVETVILSRDSFYNSDETIRLLQKKNIGLIVLAGFLWLVPGNLVRAFPKRIINIHPALLPKFGGKGMYGAHVHKAVIDAGEKESGITIHYVNEHFDDGEQIAQFRCPVLPGDTPEILAARVQELEHAHFAEAVEKAV
ncbi:MAG: phosphoribosylglycinamide formyltransferase 1 [Bacteroidetes bacterium]|nr:MAG: phosphoribosylglycinamide formyltransferase 1 [Bacteroidota bacterium]